MKLYTMNRDTIPMRGVLDKSALSFWIKWLDEYTDDEIRLFDRELCRTPDEIAAFGLSALPRLEMARIMRVLEMNLTGRKTIDAHAPTSYALKHRAERWIQLEEGRSYYVSTLQAAVIMRVLGYRTTWEEPRRYNVSMRSYHAMCDAIHNTNVTRG